RVFFFSSRRRHTSFSRDWSSDVCSSDLAVGEAEAIRQVALAKKQAIQEITSAIGRPELATQFLVATDYLEKFGKFEARAGDKVRSEERRVGKEGGGRAGAWEKRNQADRG